MITKPHIKKALKALPLLIIFIGVLTRLNVFLHNRSFFIDEANLARNIVEKSIPEYFNSLDYEQYAPPLFLVETDLVVSVLGVRDYSFRVIPLLCGIACLVLMWTLLKDWEEEEAGKIYALGLFSFSVLAIRYGTEFKQYSSDAMLSLLLVWFAWKDRAKQWDITKTVFWLALGSIVIWYSMPSIFILTGVGLFFLSSISRKGLGRWIGVVACWLMSFAAYYYYVLSKDVFDSNLQNHHAEYFLQLFSLSKEHWTNNVELIISVFKSLTDKTTVPIVFGLITFISGLVALFRQNISLLVLLATPILALIVVSGFQLYSLIPRMTLFILPLMLMVMAIGLNSLWSLDKLVVRGLLICLITLSLINKEGYKYMYNTMEIENIKASMEVLQTEIKPDDQIYVHHEAVPAFTFYNSLSDRPFHLSKVQFGTWKTSPKSFVRSSTDRSDCWLVFSHTTQDMVLKTINSIDALGSAKVYSEKDNSSIYKFVFNKQTISPAIEDGAASIK